MNWPYVTLQPQWLHTANRSVVTVCNELFCKHSKLAAIFNVQFSHWATTFFPNCKEVDILFSFDCDWAISLVICWYAPHLPPCNSCNGLWPTSNPEVDKWLIWFYKSPIGVKWQGDFYTANIYNTYITTSRYSSFAFWHFSAGCKKDKGLMPQLNEKWVLRSCDEVWYPRVSL